MSRTHKQISVNQEIYNWLEKYQENKRLKSFNQAIEWLIVEAGYDLSNLQAIEVKKKEVEAVSR